MMTLRINTTPALELAVLDAGPQRAALNGEVPSVSVTLDNARGGITELLTVPPLRARAELQEHGATIFAGTVQSVSLAEVATLGLEA